MNVSVCGCLYGVKESIVCFTKKNEDKIGKRYGQCSECKNLLCKL
jgi:hypothetical protein